MITISDGLKLFDDAWCELYYAKCDLECAAYGHELGDKLNIPNPEIHSWILKNIKGAEKVEVGIREKK